MPAPETLNRRNRPDSDFKSPDPKIQIMNVDHSAHQKHQQSNPTTPRTVTLPNQPIIFNSLRSSNNGISPTKVMQMNDAAMSISNHVSNSMT